MTTNNSNDITSADLVPYLMDRFGILTRLQGNWPGKFGMDRISYLERELRPFQNDILELGVTTVLRTCEFPPTVKALYSACSSALKSQGVKDAAGESYCPGDIVHGERTFTPREAAEEMIRIGKECPEALLLESAQSRGTSHIADSLDLVITRIYVKALRRCVAMDPYRSVFVPSHDHQPELF
jgi:hypothetical protein